MSGSSDPDLSPRLRVGLVGAGRAGVVLGAALERVGHRVVAVSAVSDLSRERVAMSLPRSEIGDAVDVVKDVDLVLVAVPDDELPDLVSGLAATGSLHPGQILVHTSPGVGISVLEPAVSADVLPLAIHPAVTLGGRPADVDRLRGAVFAVTTLRSLRPLGEALVIEMGGEPVWIEEEDRPAYAAALAAVREGVLGVLGAAGRVLSDCGIPNPALVLAPLVSATAEEAWSGSSVARGLSPQPDPSQRPGSTPEEPE